MADDIKLKFSAETSDAQQKVERFDKAVDHVGDTAEKSGKKTAAGGADLEQVGNKSERAASSLMQLSGAVAQIGKGGVSLQSISILAKEATGSLGDLGDTLTKMGGAQAGVGKLLQGVSGVIGPLGVVVAGATAIYTVWQSISDSIKQSEQHAAALAKQQEETLKKQEEALAYMREHAEAMQSAMERSFAPRGTEKETGRFKNIFSTVQDPGVSGLDTEKLVRELVETSFERQDIFRKQLGPATAEQSEGERARILDLMKDAAEGFRDAQVELDTLLQGAAERFGELDFLAGAAASKGVKALLDLVEQNTQAEADAADAAQQRAERAQEKASMQAEQATRLKQTGAEQTALAAAGEALARRLVETGDTTEQALAKVRDAMKKEGQGGDGLVAILHAIGEAMTRDKTAFEKLADAIDQRVAAQKQQADREAGERLAKEQQAAAERLAQEKAVADNLADAVKLLQQLKGDENEARTRITDAMVQAGVPFAKAGELAGKMVAKAGEQIAGGKEQQQIAKGMAGAGKEKTVGDLIKEERDRTRRGEEGAAETDAAAIQKGRNRFRDQVAAERPQAPEPTPAAAAAAARGARRRRGLAAEDIEQAGRAPSPADKAVHEEAMADAGTKMQDAAAGFGDAVQTLEQLFRDEFGKERAVAKAEGRDADPVAAEFRARQRAASGARDRRRAAESPAESPAEPGGQQGGEGGVRDRMADREKGFEEQAGRKPTTAEMRQMAREEFAANRAAQHERGPVGGPQPGQPDKPKRAGDFIREERERRGRGEEGAAESDADAIARGRDRFKAQAQPAPGSRRAKQQQAATGGARQQGGGQQQGGEGGASGFNPEEVAQEIQQMNQNLPAAMNEILGTLAQVVGAIGSWNMVMKGSRQTAQTIRSQLPGPGASRY